MTREEEFFNQFLAELTQGSSTDGYDGIAESEDGDNGGTGWYITPKAKERLTEILILTN